MPTTPNTAAELPTSTPPAGSARTGSARTGSVVARFARRWAPWRVVVAVLGVIAAIHVLWALGIWWPASSSDTLADAVVGRRPFPPSALNLGVAGALVAGCALIVGSMRSDLPPRWSRLCCLGANVVAVVLALRGVFGEIGSITGVEGSTTQYRILDIVVFSPLCLWAALGIYYRTNSTEPRKTESHNPGAHNPGAQP